MPIHFPLNAHNCHLKFVHMQQETDFLRRVPYLSAFRDRGVPGPTSEMSPRAPAQMGRRETEREGVKRQPEREGGGNPAAFVFVPRLGRVRLQ
jgi:hypothetical protein